MKHPSHILVVDDEPGIRALLCRTFEAEGYVTSEAQDKATVFRCLETENIELITLDLDLGVDDGLRLAREIRNFRSLPILMVTGLDSVYDRIKGLESGADDYVTKPFHVREVVLRVAKLLELYATKSVSSLARQRLSFETGILDVPKRELRDQGGQIVDLTNAEYALLEFFLTRPSRILSRDELSQHVLGRAWSPLERTIDGHVARLRRKIEPAHQEAPTLIKSVRGVGYVFAGQVTDT